MLRAPLASLRRDGTARSLGALLAMLALLLQLGVPAAHDPVGLGAVVPWLGSALCRAGSDAANRFPPADNPAPSDRKTDLCPVCVLLQACSSFIVPPIHASLVAALPLSIPPVPPHAAVLIAYLSGFTAQPRAPPAA